MFEKFTEGARRVVVLAQEDARMLNHSYIGTEHFLLGFLHERRGIAAQVLERLGVGSESVRGIIEEIVGPGVESPSGHMPFTPRAKAILQAALHESQELKHDEIDTQHLLLGLLRGGDGLAVEIMVRLGASPERVRAEVLDALGREDDGRGDPDASVSALGRLRGLLGGDRGGSAPGRSLSDGPVVNVRRATKVARTLEWNDPVGVSLSGRARAGGLDPLIGRPELAVRLLAVVCRRGGNNALLVGESRVGKTALISGLVQTIVDAKDDAAGGNSGVLLDVEVWQVAHTALWTARVNTLIDHGAGAVMFVVEDLDHLLAADQSGSGFASATLNTLCHSSGPMVATISPSGYASLVADQPLLATQFQRIEVPPTDAAETAAILTGLREQYQGHHGVTITDEAISAAPALAAEFLPERRLPGAALDLIDAAGAKARAAGATRGGEAVGAGAAVVDERMLAETAREIAGELPVDDDRG